MLTMHGPINVKSPNNISKWQMGFNSTFKWLIQLFLLMMSTGVLETCRELEQIYTKKKELCVKLVIYKN